MEEMILGVYGRVDQSRSIRGERSSSRPSGGGRFSRDYVDWTEPKIGILEFPRYDGGSDPTGWIYEADQFFSYYKIPEDKKVVLAYFHLDGKAFIWSQVCKMNSKNEPITWDSFTEELMYVYGPLSYQDFCTDLWRLKQTGSVLEYQAQFYGLLLMRAGRLTNELKISFFLGGLKEHILLDVQASNPTTLAGAVALARHYEAKANLCKGVQAAGAKKSPQFQLSNNFKTNRVTCSTLVRKFTTEEIDERYIKGLCFHCDEKFTPGHKCQKLFTIVAINSEEETGEEEAVLEEECEQDVIPTISPNTSYGVHRPQTMKVLGKVEGQSLGVTFSIENNSPYNFLRWDVARRLGLKIEADEEMRVAEVYGDKLSCEGVCSDVKVCLQDATFSVDFFIVNKQTTEGILGVPWLEQLGAVLLNFRSLYMRFEFEGKTVELKGIKAPTNHSV